MPQVHRAGGGPAERRFTFTLRLGTTGFSPVLVARNCSGGTLVATVHTSAPWLVVIDPATGSRVDRFQEADLPQGLQLKIVPGKDPSIGAADRRTARVDISYISGGQNRCETLSVLLVTEARHDRLRRVKSYALAWGLALAPPHVWAAVHHAQVSDPRLLCVLGAAVTGLGLALLLSDRLGDPRARRTHAWRLGVVSVGWVVALLWLHGAALMPLCLLVVLPWPLSVALVHALFSRRPQRPTVLSLSVPVLTFGVCALLVALL